MKRESGYYWIKLHGEWMIGYYSHSEWNIYENFATFDDEELDEIDENRIKRAEDEKG